MYGSHLCVMGHNVKTMYLKKIVNLVINYKNLSINKGYDSNTSSIKNISYVEEMIITHSKIIFYFYSEI